MTVKEEQKEEEDYYPSSSQYRPDSSYLEVTTTLIPEPGRAQETTPENRQEENQKMKHDNLDADSEMDYDSDDIHLSLDSSSSPILRFHLYRGNPLHSKSLTDSNVSLPDISSFLY